MKKIGTLLLFLILCPVYVSGQGEASNWYFGNEAGIRFNNDGSVTALKNGKLNTFEGCAAISDTFGNLLFYTDGVTVYDQTNEIMQNGGGLYGDPSSTQSALIIPKPQDPNLYFIFTVDTTISETDPDFGLNYSVVDISLNNGKGAVIQKNVNLLRDCSEKISAVLKDCSDNSIWVLTLAAADGTLGRLNTFYAYEINTTGVVNTPVKSTFDDLFVNDPRGYLKLSADGTKMVSANVTSGLYLYDFDATTGTLSNQQRITIGTPYQFAYGVEFSPNSDYLYVHSSNNVLDNSDQLSQLLQYDLTETDISASEVLLDSREIFRGALQMANNGKIYRTIAMNYFQGTPYLGAINNPDEKGTASNYEHKAVFLAGNATQGLPPFIQSFFGKTQLVLNSDGTRSSILAKCTGESFRLEAEEIPGARYTWLKNGVPIVVPSGYYLEIANADNDDSGRYSLEITQPNPSACPILGEALVNILPVPDPVLSITKCDLDIINSTDGITTINLDEINSDPDILFYFYESISNRGDDIRITSTSGYQNTSIFNQTLYYKAVNIAGCEYLGEIQLEISPVTIEASPYGPFYSCDEISNDEILLGNFDLEAIADNYANEEIRFYETREDLALEQNELKERYISEGATIFVRLENIGQCPAVNTIELVVTESPVLSLEESYILCLGTELFINAPEGFNSYRWFLQINNREELISENRGINLTEAGNYILETTFIYDIDDNEILCENSVNFVVIPSSTPNIRNVNITDFSTNNSIEIEATGEGLYEYSIDGINYQTENIFYNIEPGFLTLTVRDANGCGKVEKNISVMGYPKFFTPNGDGINDYWQITGINEQFQADALIAIFDRYGKFVAQINPGEEGWNGTSSSNVLPASDYWFNLKLRDGREIKGHFTLKR
ncbi:T9SS type B sorting domain-containing protein [Eudoraea sp.]|uniref:T9SS type B sorting domain-containing protein n=1 Tax=Eudoraea sp. TaxID=1979955 RepID=UPI003C771153